MVLKNMSYIGINLYFGGFLCGVLNETLPLKLLRLPKCKTNQEGENQVAGVSTAFILKILSQVSS